MKLPVRFSRILFLRSPGAAVRVRTSVVDHSDDFVEGRLSLYNDAGEPCVLVDGFRAIAVAGTRRSSAPGGTRDVVYHVGWDRTPSTGPKAAVPPVPLKVLHAAATKALDDILSNHGRD